MDSARFEIAIHDPVAQTVAFQRIVISEGSTRMVPHFMRYAWPSELDLMAQLAGLERRERWAWWDRSPFTATNYEKENILLTSFATVRLFLQRVLRCFQPAQYHEVDDAVDLVVGQLAFER